MELIAWLLIRKDEDEYTIKIEKIIRVLKVNCWLQILIKNFNEIISMKNATIVKFYIFIDQSCLLRYI